MAFESAALLICLFSGCRHVPFDYPRESSQSLPPAVESPLGERARPWLEADGAQSGFYPLLQGSEALGARLDLMERAQQSIDLQYFLMKPDFAGILFADRLLDAADRGVRIRFLLDDIFTSVSDSQLAILNAHPNIEIRLFNPLARGVGRWTTFLFNMSLSNRRMHNKSLTVDNVVTIVGGRNIADEYYDIREGTVFSDFDMLGIGPVAEDVSACFDLFWNCSLAVPLAAFHDEDQPPPVFESTEELEARATEIYHQAVDSQLVDELRTGAITLFPADADVVTDPPEKLENPKRSGMEHLFEEVVSRIERSREELIIITPYFVPGREGVDFLLAERARGLEVTVITNSLASNNHPHVHGGYAPWRKKLLRAGVHLYEAKVDSGVSRITGEQQGLTLHTKLLIFDRQTLFFGSLNMDPRSVILNSEMGLFIKNSELAGAIAQGFMDAIPRHAYQVTLDTDGKLLWTYDHGDVHIETKREPDATFKMRFLAFMARILPVEGQL